MIPQHHGTYGTRERGRRGREERVAGLRARKEELLQWRGWRMSFFVCQDVVKVKQQGGEFLITMIVHIVQDGD